jgi:hypothetical protein
MTVVPFVLVTVPVSDRLRDMIDSSSVIRAPRSLFRGGFFRADPEATPVTRPDGSILVRFGSSRLSEAICVDLRTNAVVSVWDEDAVVIKARRPAWREGFVNSDLDAFIEVARAVYNRFPYYAAAAFDTEAGYRGVEQVQQELLALIARIDPPAAVPDRFWSTFVDDVGIGDFSNEDVLDPTGDKLLSRQAPSNEL